MKQTNRMRIIYLFLPIIVTLTCQSWQNAIRNSMKIEHVYNRPADAYGPAMVVAYTSNSDYTRGCWAWTVLGIGRDSYINEIKKEIKKSNSSDILKKSNIASLEVKQKDDLTFNIKLDAKDKGGLDAKYHSIS